MFKRKIESELMKWKDNLSKKRKAFVLKGLRQVGKTVSIKSFAKKHTKTLSTSISRQKRISSKHLMVIYQ